MLAFLAAGCGTPRPSDERVLFNDAEERARRDVLAIYYSESQDGTQFSIVVPRSGDAEFRSELGTRGNSAFLNSLVAQGSIQRRRREMLPVTPDQRTALEARFAALPRGESEWSLPRAVKTEQPPPFCGPEMESSPVASTLRMVLVSRTGELQTVVVYQGSPNGASASAKPGGEAVSALKEAFRAIVLPASK